MKRSIFRSHLVLWPTLLAASTAAGEPLAKVGDRVISRAAVEKEMSNELLEFENTRYQILKEGLNGLISEALFELEAKAQELTAEELASKEVLKKVPDPTDEEIRALYEAQKAGLGNATLEDIRESAIDYLKQVKISARHDEYVAELKKKYPTTISLRPPTVDVSVGTRTRGAEDAPITIVEFADYECPYCKRAKDAVDKVIKTYGDQVRFSYRDYPLSFHENAQAAAEGGHCANAQGLFWSYHDKVMASPDVSPAALKSIAGAIGLDQEKFDTCMDKNEQKAAVEADIAAAKELGINGTPVFYVNGRIVDGAQPFEAFREVIEEELARAKLEEAQ